MQDGSEHVGAPDRTISPCKPSTNPPNSSRPPALHRASGTYDLLFEGASLNDMVQASTVPGLSIVAATVDLGTPVTAAIRHENLLAVQFHPEKSQQAGARLLQAFLDWTP